MLSPYDMGTAVTNAFLMLILLSVIGTSVSDVLGQLLGVTGKGKRIISTVFCAIIVVWWRIGLFTVLFGEPKLSWVPLFATMVDIVGTSLIVGTGSGYVFDLFTLVITKVKEWREVSINNRQEVRIKREKRTIK